MRKEHENITIWVTARQAFGVAMEALTSHKLRSFLTLLGVVIATTTLIVVMSIVNGMNVYIAEHIANLGTNTFVLHQFQWAQGFDSFLKARRRNQPIRMEDYDYLRDNLRGYQSMSAMTQLQPSPRARYKTNLIEEINLMGMTPSHADIGREKVAYGRYLNDSDYQHNARVCFIGQDLVEKLFPMVDPLDKEVLLAGLPFRVIGVAERVGSTFGQSQDNFAFVPLTTFRVVWKGRPELFVFIKAPDGHTAAREGTLKREYGMLILRHTTLGGQVELIPILSTADLFLMPSQSESFGLSALEAMSCGVPVISSSVGGLPELQVHGETGFIAEIGDIDRMARYAVDLLSNPSKHELFSAAARKRAQEFESDKIVRMYEQYYEKVLSA